MTKKDVVSVLLLIIVGIFFVFNKPATKTEQETEIESEVTPVPSPTPSPTPKPLTFAEMNELYGPCVYAPTLMYHHIQDMETAISKNQQNLSVSPETFQQQLSYLTQRGYNFVSMQDLVNFFDAGAALPSKPVLLTFDDGYENFASQALPILNQFGAKATLFMITGLSDNSEYLSWNQISAFPGTILTANHTWSHINTQGNVEKVTSEITLADSQLSSRGLNNPKVFSYPYGLVGASAKTILSELGYSLAFTTKPGSTLCKQQRLELPRIRVGNGSLSTYGL